VPEACIRTLGNRPFERNPDRRKVVCQRRFPGAPHGGKRRSSHWLRDSHGARGPVNADKSASFLPAASPPCRHGSGTTGHDPRITAAAFTGDGFQVPQRANPLGWESTPPGPLSAVVVAEQEMVIFAGAYNRTSNPDHPVRGLIVVCGRLHPDVAAGSVANRYRFPGPTDPVFSRSAVTQWVVPLDSRTATWV